jgi:Ohr subfamily peroxiredoxin
MSKLESVLYTAKVRTSNGRDGGVSRTDDGRLQVTLSQPGTSGTGTNPEQLFAIGWSACFLSAIKLAAAKMRIVLPADAAIDAEVDLGMNQDIYGLAARLIVSLPGIDQETAQLLVDAASHLCPYTLAVRGNIDATYSTAASKPVDRVREA